MIPAVKRTVVRRFEHIEIPATIDGKCDRRRTDCMPLAREREEHLAGRRRAVEQSHRFGSQRSPAAKELTPSISRGKFATKGCSGNILRKHLRIMSPAADRRSSELTEALLCELAGCTRQTRKSWISRGLLKEARGGYGEFDALELLCLSKLLGLVGPRDTGIIWPDVQAILRSNLMTGRADFVIDLQFKTVALVRDDASLSSATRHGRPVRVVPLGEEIADLLEAVRNVRTRLEASSPRQERRNRVSTRSARRDDDAT
ncbi:hypothetical protein [Conexibacter sp. CPCC 206217]|uniref:hypothetical protein n=1 Tax=Conexibacter sp. CPCC 206217 TaxID=3064574 RepID=UPI002728AFD0|nr:hypothetical protein [Conexibacter sp. CPCC 206217]MDO8210261.1 hypothetical protein [Conexibacter sp. CPCC 206217]